MNIQHLQRAIECALRAEQKGNLPVGAVIVLDDVVIAEGEIERMINGVMTYNEYLGEIDGR